MARIVAISAAYNTIASYSWTTTGAYLGSTTVELPLEDYPWLSGTFGASQFVDTPTGLFLRYDKGIVHTPDAGASFSPIASVDSNSSITYMGYYDGVYRYLVNLGGEYDYRLHALYTSSDGFGWSSQTFLAPPGAVFGAVYRLGTTYVFTANGTVYTTTDLSAFTDVTPYGYSYLEPLNVLVDGKLLFYARSMDYNEAAGEYGLDILAFTPTSGFTVLVTLGYISANVMAAGVAATEAYIVWSHYTYGSKCAYTTNGTTASLLWDDATGSSYATQLQTHGVDGAVAIPYEDTVSYAQTIKLALGGVVSSITTPLPDGVNWSNMFVYLSAGGATVPRFWSQFVYTHEIP